MTSQLERFRELCRQDLLPRIVTLDLFWGLWRCAWCDTATPVKDAPAPQMARHTTYCRIREAATVWE